MKVDLQLVLFTLALLILSCQPKEFEENTRIIIKGEVVDAFNNEIENASINIYTIDRVATIFNIFPFIPLSTQRFLLGETNSQASGEFSVTSLLNRSDNLIVEVENGTDYTSYMFATSILDYTPEDFTINLNTITLKQRATLTLQVNNQANAEAVVLNVLFELPLCQELFVEGEFQAEQSMCYVQREQSYSFNNQEFSRTIFSTLNSTVQISYSVNNQPEVTETIILNQLENVYTISL